MLVILAFKSTSLVPWKIRNRWMNCLELLQRINFKISQIYREDNNCVNSIVSLSFDFFYFHWWDSIPNSISDNLYCNRICIPNYRFK